MGILELIIAPIIVAIVLFFILPFLNKPRDKFIAWIKKKLKKESRKKVSIIWLQAICNLFRYINDFLILDSLSDTDLAVIKDTLYGIKTTADSIKYRKFRKLKKKIIKFSEKINNIYEGISEKEILRLFFDGEDNINELGSEIESIVDPSANRDA